MSQLEVLGTGSCHVWARHRSQSRPPALPWEGSPHQVPQRSPTLGHPQQQLRPIGEIADGLDGWIIGALKGQLRSSNLLGRGDV